MSHLKIISSKIQVEQARIKVQTTPLLIEDQLYTIANEPIITINGEKMVPIE